MSLKYASLIESGGSDFVATAILNYADHDDAGLTQLATDLEAAAATRGDRVLIPSSLPNIPLDTFTSGTTPVGHLPYAAANGAVVWGAAPTGGASTDDQTAAEVSVDTTNFSQNLDTCDDVQECLEDIDEFSQYQGTWQQAPWPAGVIVRRSGIPYLSLVNNNTEIPIPASTQWTGLPEGFIYRGAAPILATNYNYGQVVLNPDTDVYYYFTSTISASVARADIATHANFQAISGETGHSPRVGSGNAFPTTPAPLASDIFFFDADVASGLDWLDTDGTTDLTAAVAGDMARYDGTDWIKVVNLVGGGGIGGSPDFFDAPIEDVATIDVSEVTPENYLAIDANNVITNRGGFTIEVGTNTHQAIKVPVDGNYTISAVTSIQQLTAGVPRNRTRFQFFIVRAGVDVPAAGSGLYSSYGRATVPAGFTDGSYTVDLLADDQIEMRYSDELATSATYTLGGGLSRISVLLNSGGGLSTSEQQELVTEARLVDTEIISSTNALSTTATSTPMDSVFRDTFDFTTIPIEDFERIDIGLELDGTFDFVVPIRISRQMMLDIPTSPADLYPDGGTTTRRLAAVYWSGRVSAGINSEIGTAVTRPIFSWVDGRRSNGIESLSIAFTKNVDGDISQMHTYASSDVIMRMRYAVIRHYE